MKCTIIFLLLCHSLLSVSSAVAADRILALTPHACEIFYAIKAERKLVGAVDYCDYPAAALRLPRVGNYAGINVEAALQQRPDAAVVMGRQVAGVSQLESLGVRIVVSNPTSLQEVLTDIDRLGQLANRQVEAKKLVRHLAARLASVRAQSVPHTRVFYEIWSDPLLTAGGTSFISDLIAEAGGINVFADINQETARVNVESVIQARPQLIVIPLEKRNLAERRRFWHHWLGHDVRLIAINPDLVHRPGPRLMDGLELLQKAFLGVGHAQ